MVSELIVVASDDLLEGSASDSSTVIEPGTEPVPDAPVTSDYADLFDLETDEDVQDAVPRTHHITAVLVAHDGARWLPATLTALSRSTRRPDRVVVVDTGSSDTTGAIALRAESAGLVDRIVTLPRVTAFGAAVAAALATGSGATIEDPDTLTWAWLLHDDSAPAPTALVELLRAADRERDVTILGAKLRGWRNQDVLVECGVTVARSGNRVTGLERRELDQGQHDGVGEVLAVSSAGMLVRRDVWDALGGFDPALPVFRDDVDFCWRARRAGHRVIVATEAVVHHREAATHRRRPVDAGSPKHPDRQHRLDRVAAIHLLRSHASGPGGLFVTVRLLVGSLLRAIGLLLGKAPQEARDEWGAFRDAVRDRSGLRASRIRVAAADSQPGAVPARDVRHLLAPRGIQARHALESAADLIAGRESADVTRSVLDSTPDDPDGWYADDRRPSRLRRVLARPGTLLLLVLLACALIGVRALFGDGVLQGGALLPAPEGAADLWTAYTSGWHEVGPGSAADSPAWLVPLAALAVLTRGSATWAVDLVLLGLVPLAGLTSYLAMRGVVTATWIRVWAAATYATLPAVTGAISGGRIGTAVTIAVLPWLARSCAGLAGVGSTPTWRRAFGTALLLAVATAFTPVIWLAAVPLAAAAAVFLVRDAVGRLRLLAALLLPIALLVPWSLRLLREPSLLWLEPGIIGPTDARLAPYDVLLLRPGGAGSTPLWLGVGLVVAGFAALLVPGPRRPVLAAWAVGLVGLALGVAQSVLRVWPDVLDAPIAPWPGVMTMLWGGALILLAALALDRIPASLVGASFGWRQPATAALVALLALAPLASLGLLLLGVDGPLTRGPREVLPAFVAAEMRGELRPRSIVLRRSMGDLLVYDLLAAPEPQLGDIDVAAPASVSAQLDRLVARLAAGLGADEVDQLATHGIRYVVVADAAPRDDHLVASLDGQRGLRRLSSRDGTAVWQLVPVASRSQLIDPTEGASAGTVTVRSSTPVPVIIDDPRTTTRIDSVLPAGKAGRTLVLSESQDSRWRWKVDGADVTPAAGHAGDGADADPSLQQAGVVATSAPVSVAFDASSRSAWLWAQAAVLLLVLLLALPSRRAEVDDDSDILDEATALDPASAAPAPEPGLGTPEVGA